MTPSLLGKFSLSFLSESILLVKTPVDKFETVTIIINLPKFPLRQAAGDLGERGMAPIACPGRQLFPVSWMEGKQRMHMPGRLFPDRMIDMQISICKITTPCKYVPVLLALFF